MRFFTSVSRMLHVHPCCRINSPADAFVSDGEPAPPPLRRTALRYPPLPSLFHRSTPLSTFRLNVSYIYTRVPCPLTSGLTFSFSSTPVSVLLTSAPLCAVPLVTLKPNSLSTKHSKPSRCSVCSLCLWYTEANSLSLPLAFAPSALLTSPPRSSFEHSRRDPSAHLDLLGSSDARYALLRPYTSPWCVHQCAGLDHQSTALLALLLDF